MLLSRVLAWLKARRVLDLANACAATGWIRDGVVQGGHVLSVVREPLRKVELGDRFRAGGVEHKVHCEVGETAEVVRGLQSEQRRFDVVLLDAAADDCDDGFDAAMADPPDGLLETQGGCIIFRGRKRDTLCVLRRQSGGKAAFHLVDGSGVRTIHLHQSKMKDAFHADSPRRQSSDLGESPECFNVLGLNGGASSEQVEQRFRNLQRVVASADCPHGSQEAQQRLVAARDAALARISAGGA
mmetsp:Transcript_53875/g.143396  ORF Transcript_53875/g.143396 Transcript_53875/m.143396 type:complete len:242 (-) Transcript_53875:105-830(-)